MNPIESARLLSALVGSLIPGDDSWPAAEVVGVQALVAARMVDTLGEIALDELLASLAGYPELLDSREAKRVAAVARFEAAEPERFKWVCEAAFFAYYESPLVVRAMNALGIVYQLRPHADGYDLPPFDPTTDAPGHRRGRWIAVEPTAE
jgi:hypothetical protein